jgi:tol-pal system protein YbgF
MKRFVLSIIAVSVTASLAAPAQAQNREHQQMAAELRILQEQQREQALQIEKIATALTAVTDAVKALNTRLDTSDTAARKFQADEKTLFDNLNTTLRAINERTSDTNARIGSLREDIGALSNAVAAGAASAPGPPTSTSSAAAPDLTVAGGTTPVTGTPTSRPAPGVTPSRLYDTAWADFTAGNMQLAITGFETFLREYPKGQQAVDAQFYIGESQMKLKNLPAAIAAYTAVTQNYPNSGDRVPNAYYRLGEAQRTQGQIEAARAAWDTVVRKYPDSNWGILAKQRLDGLPPPAPARP